MAKFMQMINMIQSTSITDIDDFLKYKIPIHNKPIFKIYGERNSGTNFLERILYINGFEYFSEKRIKDIYFFWKHGTPNNIIKRYAKPLVEIFIFRKLDDWLISMFHNPYHLNWNNQEKNFSKFLTKKQSKELVCNISQNQKTYMRDYRTNNYINLEDDGKTIFEIRYYKYKSIIEYFYNNNNVIIVSLHYLQNNNNLIHFLKSISETYNIKLHNVNVNLPHTKSNLPYVKNTKYNININNYRSIIDKYKNSDIEKNIDNLEFIIQK